MTFSPGITAAVSGIFFALIGIAYRFAGPRKIHELHVIGVASVFGTAVFLLKALPIHGDVPGIVVGLGIACGVTQYLTVYGVRAGLRLGPLTAVWCAVMLYFLPASAYAAWMFGERITAFHYGSAVAGIACVVMAATLSNKGEGGPQPGKKSAAAMVLYGVVLLLILGVNSLVSLSAKHLSMMPSGLGDSMMDRYGNVFRTLLYGSIFLSVVVDQIITRRPLAPPLPTIAIGALAGVGTIVGMWLFCACASAPAASVFVLNTVASILFAAIAGALWFKEARSWRWYLTLALGLLSATLSQGEYLWGFVSGRP